MDFLLPDNSEPQHLQYALPLHLAKFAVAGAQCRYRRFKQGEYLTQVIPGNDYSIWVHYFFIKETIQFQLFTPENIIALHYMLEGNISATLEGVGNVSFEKGKYHLFYIPGEIAHGATLHPGFYQFLHINFHPVHLEIIAKQYPMFEPMLSKAVMGIKTGHQHHAAVITPTIRDLIDQILHNSLRPAERMLFMESSIRNLLRIYIQDIVRIHNHVSIRDPRVKLLSQVEEYINKHLDKKIDVDTIAKQFNISRSWLQQVSKDVTGQGIHRLVKHKRMEAAARLLLDTDYSVSKIVTMISTMTFAAFTAAFHKYYGTTPLQYRKNRGQKP